MNSGLISRPKITDATTSERSSGFQRYKQNADSWTEMELDCLWVGIRKYGQRNWNAILADPRMILLRKRTPQELSARWDQEVLKIFPTAQALPIRRVHEEVKNQSVSKSTIDINMPSQNYCTLDSHNQLPIFINVNSSLTQMLNSTPQKASTEIESRKMHHSSSSLMLLPPAVEMDGAGRENGNSKENPIEIE